MGTNSSNLSLAQTCNELHYIITDIYARALPVNLKKIGCSI